MRDHMVVLYTYCYLDLFLYVDNLVGWKHTNLGHHMDLSRVTNLFKCVIKSSIF